MKIVNDASSKKYDIAVFVLSFNHVQFIEQALNSILEQTLNHTFHIFINDDASTDGTQEILLQYSNQYPEKITLILQSENQYRQGKTIGIDLFRYSNSDFIAYCEADDFWNTPTKLEKQLNFLSRNEKCSLVHSAIQILVDGGWSGYSDRLKRHLQANLPANVLSTGQALCRNNFIMTCSVMIRRNAIPELLLSDLGALMPQDWILFALATRFGSIGYVDETLSTYRLHNNNYFASENPTLVADMQSFREFINRFSPYDFT